MGFIKHVICVFSLHLFIDSTIHCHCLVRKRHLSQHNMPKRGEEKKQKQKQFSQRFSVNYINYSFCQVFVVLLRITAYNRERKTVKKKKKNCIFWKRADNESSTGKVKYS